MTLQAVFLLLLLLGVRWIPQREIYPVGGKGSGKHLKGLNRVRSLTPHVCKKSEKSISDGQKLKREMEAKKAASMWLTGMNKERGK